MAGFAEKWHGARWSSDLGEGLLGFGNRRELLVYELQFFLASMLKAESR